MSEPSIFKLRWYWINQELQAYTVSEDFRSFKDTIKYALECIKWRSEEGEALDKSCRHFSVVRLGSQTHIHFYFYKKKWNCPTYRHYKEALSLMKPKDKDLDESTYTQIIAIVLPELAKRDGFKWPEVSRTWLQRSIQERIKITENIFNRAVARMLREGLIIVHDKFWLTLPLGIDKAVKTSTMSALIRKAIKERLYLWSTATSESSVTNVVSRELSLTGGSIEVKASEVLTELTALVDEGIVSKIGGMYYKLTPKEAVKVYQEGVA